MNPAVFSKLIASLVQSNPMSAKMLGSLPKMQDILAGVPQTKVGPWVRGRDMVKMDLNKFDLSKLYQHLDMSDDRAYLNDDFWNYMMKTVAGSNN